MVYIVIGDMHLGKKLIGIISNPFSTSIEDRTFILWSRSCLQHIEKNLIPIADSIGNDSIRWIFLGDIYDYPKVKMNLEFKRLIDRILDQNDEWSVDILVGNHDISKIGDSTRTALMELQEYRNKVQVYLIPTIKKIDDDDVLFFPYVKRENILFTLHHFSKNLTQDLPIVFSHNNIYLSDSFMSTPMISKKRVEESLGKSIILFNGHIHRSYYEPNYYQVGSSIPTSFKEKPQAIGTCIFNNRKIDVIRNNRVMLLSISKSYYLQELEWYLNEALNWGTVIYLKIGQMVESAVLELVKKYKDCIPGIMLESQKHP